MKSYNEYISENINEGKDRSSNKIKAMSTLVSAIKSSLNQYDISTRHFVWDHLNSPKGKELMEKIIRNPKTYLSDSEFTKLVMKK